MVLVSALVSSVLVTGCGGGSSTSGAALSFSQFQAQANNACRQAATEVEALSTPKTLTELATVAASMEPIAADALRKLNALTPPPQDQALWNQYLSDTKAQASALSALRAAVETGKRQAAQKFAGVINSKSGNSVATDLKLNECARNAQPGGGEGG